MLVPGQVLVLMPGQALVPGQVPGLVLALVQVLVPGQVPGLVLALVLIPVLILVPPLLNHVSAALFFEIAWMQPCSPRVQLMHQVHARHQHTGWTRHAVRALGGALLAVHNWKQMAAGPGAAQKWQMREAAPSRSWPG